MEDREPRFVTIVGKVRVEAGELIGRGHRLVGDRPERTGGDVQPGALRSRRFDPATHPESASLPFGLIDPKRPEEEGLFDVRECCERGPTESIAVDGNVSESQILDAFRVTCRGHEIASRGSIVRSHEEHRGADPLGLASTQGRSEDAPGQGEKEPGTVSGEGVGRDRAVVFYAAQSVERGIDDSPRGSSLQVGDEADPARVPFVPWGPEGHAVVLSGAPGIGKGALLCRAPLLTKYSLAANYRAHRAVSKTREPPGAGPERFAPPKPPCAVTRAGRSAPTALPSGQVCG